MKAHFRYLLVALLISYTVCAAGGEHAEEIIIADRINWANYPAFYIDAPASIRGSMEAGLQQYLAEDSMFCDELVGTMWVCGEDELRYFQAVSGGGDYLQSGFACQVGEDFPHQKYYPLRLLNLPYCITLDWGDNGEHFLSLASE